MKKIFVSVLAISAFALSAGAQTVNNSTPAPAMNKEHKEWNHQHKGMGMKELNLTQDQKDQLKANREEYRKQLMAINKDESQTVKEMRDKKYALKQEQKAKFLNILTPDQKAKLNQLKQQRQQKHEEMAAKRLDKMKTNLNLTDDQVAQIKSQQESIHSKMKSIKENQSLDRVSKKEQLQALRTESKENFKKILTPDQLNKLEQMKKDRMEKFQHHTNPA